jgi:hypothetical protein
MCSKKLSQISEIDKVLHYTNRSSIPWYPASKSVLKYEDSLDVSGCLYVKDVPKTLIGCRNLVSNVGTIATFSPLRVLDRVFAGYTRDYLETLQIFGHSPDSDVYVLPMKSKRGISKLSFRFGSKRNHIINLYPFGDTYEEAWRCAAELYKRYGIGIESMVSPASVLAKIFGRRAATEFDVIDLDVEKYAYQCFKAGRFEAIELGTQDVDVYDYNSAYLWAVSRLQTTHKAFTYWLSRGPILDDITDSNVEYIFAKCRVGCGTSTISPLFMRLLEARNVLSVPRIRNVTPANICVDIWLTKPELQVLRTFGASIEFISGKVGVIRCECRPFRELANGLYNMRELFNKAFKHIDATVLGKMASVIHTIHDDGSITYDTSPIFNTAYAAHAAGLVRAVVTQMALEDPSNIVRLAIDCVWKKKGSKVPSAVIGTGLGQLKKATGRGRVFTDQFADKPSKDKYAMTLRDNTIIVGDTVNYPSVFGSLEKFSGELQSNSFIVPCHSNKRFTIGDADLNRYSVGTSVIDGVEQLKRILSVSEKVHIAEDFS